MPSDRDRAAIPRREGPGHRPDRVAERFKGGGGNDALSQDVSPMVEARFGPEAKASLPEQTGPYQRFVLRTEAQIAVYVGYVSRQQQWIGGLCMEWRACPGPGRLKTTDGERAAQEKLPSRWV